MARRIQSAHLSQQVSWLLCHSVLWANNLFFPPLSEPVSLIYLAFFFLCWNFEFKPGELHTTSRLELLMQYHHILGFLVHWGVCDNRMNLTSVSFDFRSAKRLGRPSWIRLASSPPPLFSKLLLTKPRTLGQYFLFISLSEANLNRCTKNDKS